MAGPNGTFSNIQWYLAHARNTVHCVARTPHAVTAEEFAGIVRKVAAAAPQLLWQERLDPDRHVPAAPDDPGTLAEHREVPDLDGALPALLGDLETDFPGRDGPAFRARCLTAPGPDAQGFRSALAFESTHAIMEGGDIADILRGRGTERAGRTEVPGHLPARTRAFVAAAAPVLAPLHLLASVLERKKSADFGFAVMRLDRAGLRAAAARHGVSQQALLFALTLWALGDRVQHGRRVLMAFTTLPARRVRIASDDYLNVHIHEERLRHRGEGFDDYLATVADAIAASKAMPLATNALFSRILDVHRWLRPRLPGLYRHGFFGYVPQDIILSLMPPLGAARGFPALEGAEISAGSMTGTGPSAVFATGPAAVTLTLWAEPAMRARMPALAALAGAEGIAAEQLV